MSQALTLTEAAERLAPVFEESGSSFPVPAKPKGKWMSLENAGAVLSERVTGERPAPAKRRAEVTIRDAAKHIAQPRLETPAALPDIRKRREAATIQQLQCFVDLEDFTNRAVQQFEGAGDALAVLTSPEYQAVYSYAQQLAASHDDAARQANDAWRKQCEAEEQAFELERPDWSPADARRVAAMLIGLGVSEQEMQQLWLTPQPINVASPICLALAQMAIGADNPEPIHAALASVGFDDNEIKAAMAGEAPILLRDYRIQELVARAADAYTSPENREAA